MNPVSSSDPVYQPGTTIEQRTTNEPSILDWYITTESQQRLLNQQIKSQQVSDPLVQMSYHQGNIENIDALIEAYENAETTYEISQFNRDAINQAAGPVRDAAEALQEAENAYNKAANDLNEGNPTAWDAYNAAVQAFNQAVQDGSDYPAAAAAFNQAVSDYNNAIADFNQKAQDLNQAIAAYNSAIAPYNAQIDIANQQIDQENINRAQKGEPPLPHQTAITPISFTAVSLAAVMPVSTVTPPSPLPTPIDPGPLPVADLTIVSPQHLGDKLSDYTDGVIKSSKELNELLGLLAIAVRDFLKNSPTTFKEFRLPRANVSPNDVATTIMVLGLGNSNLLQCLNNNVVSRMSEVSGSDSPSPDLQKTRLIGELNKFIGSAAMDLIGILGALVGLGFAASLQAKDEQLRDALAIGSVQELLDFINSGKIKDAITALINRNAANLSADQKLQLQEQLTATASLLLTAVANAYLDQATSRRYNATQQTLQAYYNNRSDSLSAAAVSASQSSTFKSTTINGIQSTYESNGVSNSADLARRSYDAAMDAYIAQENAEDAIQRQAALDSSLAHSRDLARQVATQTREALVAHNRMLQDAVNPALGNNVERDFAANQVEANFSRQQALQDARDSLHFTLTPSVHTAVRQTLLSHVSQQNLSRSEAESVTKPLQKAAIDALHSDEINMEALQKKIQEIFEAAKIGRKLDYGSFSEQFLMGLTSQLAILAGLPVLDQTVNIERALAEHAQQVIQNSQRIAADATLTFNKIRDKDFQDKSRAAFDDFMAEAQNPSTTLASFLDPGIMITKVGIMYEGMEGGWKRASIQAV